MKLIKNRPGEYLFKLSWDDVNRLCYDAPVRYFRHSRGTAFNIPKPVLRSEVIDWFSCSTDFDFHWYDTPVDRYADIERHFYMWICDENVAVSFKLAWG